MYTFSAYVAFNKATDVQTDMKHEKDETRSPMSRDVQTDMKHEKDETRSPMSRDASSLAKIEFGNNEREQNLTRQR